MTGEGYLGYTHEKLFVSLNNVMNQKSFNLLDPIMDEKNTSVNGIYFNTKRVDKDYTVSKLYSTIKGKRSIEIAIDSIAYKKLRTPSLIGIMKGRISRASVCKEDTFATSRGYHAFHKMHYYGFKMQLIISKAGLPVSMGITAANVHDVQFLSELENIELSVCELIADKGYLSLPYQTTLFEQDKIKLINQLRSNIKKQTSLGILLTAISGKRVKTLFSQLCEHLLY